MQKSKRQLAAHKSPAWAGLRFEVVPSRFKEKLHKASFASPQAYAVETAKQKALEVAGRMHQKDLRAPDVVIGADTIVAVGGLILEKPVDKQDAYRMLSRLSGREHSVFTGVAVVHCGTKDGQLDTQVSEFYEETTVKFSELSEELLWEYIDSGEPMDKAGGYGIQALGGMLVEYVHGDFLNVVGFPLNRFCKELARLYHTPQAPGAPRRIHYDSIPAVDTFEDLSDIEGGGSDPASANGGLEAGGAQPWAPRTRDVPDLNGVRDSQPPIPARLLGLMDGFKASKVLLTACRLNVFDVLKDRGPLTAADVAQEIDASVDGAERLLDVCVALGLLEKADRANSTPLQYSCLENPRDAGAWWAAVHGVTRSRTQLSDCTFTHWRRKWQPTAVFCVAPGTVARQAPLSVGFSRQERWRGSPCPSPGDLPDPGIELASSVSPIDKVKSKSEVPQSCSSVHGIFQARVLEWVAIDG
ncbi:hypothetical protein FD754_020116 [Muntiacus muntjak]|uniref:O-methyltransferase dimerisation domain-containing protein n=1 Tax=Muntiacus muntjak TaxID=9888 RepID=A0A5N3V3P5_MUNMU|nr:hypothetical protein FD754_020116 [Muntiacus muntjak]